MMSPIQKLQMIAIDADLDCRYERDRVEFSLMGFDDRDPLAGRGWAKIGKSGRMTGMLFLHNGDETAFEAEKSEAPPVATERPQARRRRW